MDDGEWRLCPLYLGNLDDLVKEDIIDVLRLTLRPKKFLKRPGMTDNAKRARDALEADPYNLQYINELGRIYASEAEWERSVNVLLRGWKRAKEIEDKKVRFHFLMKICEVSYYLSQFRQAHAVLHDMEEPEDPQDLGSYLVLACQVYGANGDLQRALKAFQRLVEPRSFQDAVRIFGLTLRELKKAGGYEAAQSAVEKKATKYDNKSIMTMLESFAEGIDKQGMSPEDIQRNLIIGGVVVLVAVLIYLLWLAEQWSLAQIGAKK